MSSNHQSSLYPWQVSSTRSVKPGRIVDYLLLAEFDIETGSTLRYQYPCGIPNCKPDWLAENMLPEGSHNREHDWTYIFLNRNQRQYDEVYY